MNMDENGMVKRLHCEIATCSSEYGTIMSLVQPFALGISKVVLEFRPIADIALASKNALAPQQRHDKVFSALEALKSKPSNVAVLLYNIL